MRYFQVFFVSFCTNSIVKYGRNFILVLLNHIIKKKVEKSHSQKRLNFRVGSKWHIFQHLFFWFFVHNSLQNHQIINVRGCFEKFRKFATRQAQDSHGRDTTENSRNRDWALIPVPPAECLESLQQHNTETWLQLGPAHISSSVFQLLSSSAPHFQTNKCTSIRNIMPQNSSR